MSVTYIQQELVTLLLSAKKALSQGRDMCSQARMYQQSSEKHIETIERIHPKLLFIDNHITLQIQYLDNMREYLISQNESRELKNKVKHNHNKIHVFYWFILFIRNEKQNYNL